MPSLGKRIKNFFSRRKPSEADAPTEEPTSNSAMIEALDSENRRPKRRRHRRRRRERPAKGAPDDARSEITDFDDDLGVLNAAEEASEVDDAPMRWAAPLRGDLDPVGEPEADPHRIDNEDPELFSALEEDPYGIADEDLDLISSSEEDRDDIDDEDLFSSSEEDSEAPLARPNLAPFDAFASFEGGWDLSSEEDSDDSEASSLLAGLVGPEDASNSAEDDADLGAKDAEASNSPASNAVAFAAELGARPMPRGVAFDWCLANGALAHPMIDEGRELGLFWEDGQLLVPRAYGLQMQAARVARLAANGRGVDHIEYMLEDELEPTPLTVREVITYAIQHGYVDFEEGAPTVLAGGVGAMARLAAEECAGGDFGRLSADRGQDGYATLGMNAKQSASDLAEGSQVQYNRTDEERQPTLLRLDGGVFQWAETGETAETPDLSGKTDDEVWASSPNFCTLRKKELIEGGMDKKAAGQAALEEVRSQSRLIFVMDRGGTFYAAKGDIGVIHHSTFLAGLDVACAGEIGLSGGAPVYLSNASGHYMPTPMYVWQAVHALANAGANVAALEVAMFGVRGTVNGQWFLDAFAPIGDDQDPRNLPADGKAAITKIEARRAGPAGGTALGLSGAMTLGETDAPLPDWVASLDDEQREQSKFYSVEGYSR